MNRSTLFIYSANGVVITLTYFLLPFAVLPIYGSMRAIPDVTSSKSRAISAPRRARRLRDVVLPQCERGIVVAFIFTFLISVGDYVTPRFVGGGAAMMGHFIETQFSFGFNWPMGSAMSFTLLAASLLIVVVFRGPAARRGCADDRAFRARCAWRAFIALPCSSSC